MNLLALPGMNDTVTVLFIVLIGILVVFLGMALIVVILQLIGKVFDKVDDKNKKPKKVVSVQEPAPVEQGLDEKTKAAIIGAIYMYYLNEGSDCEFVVRKIKRI